MAKNIPDIPVKVYNGTKIFTLQVKDGQSILGALMETDNSFTAVCGGRGSCGKCKIKVLEGYLPITASDEACLSKAELEKGVRLSCKAYPQEPSSIEMTFQGEENFQVLTETVEMSNKVEGNIKSAKDSGAYIVSEKGAYGIAIDIGTTTIAIQLLSLSSGEKIATHTTINHQRMFGADVISRITASVQGKKEELRGLIHKDLAEGIRKVVTKGGVRPEQITEVAIAGNTTMVHLLMGYDCKGLGEYPFTPVNIRLIQDSYRNIIGDDFLEASVYILPGISTFVGGDIVAGLYNCDFDTSKEYNLLIDLGTNGELALGNKEKILVTSTAAGPAFEGGNITFGVGSIEGAISGVSIDEQGAHIQTIADKAPIGICGTGVIEAVSELVKADLVDETGCLDEDYFDEGYPLATKQDGTQIVLTQADIREIQLAKAAVRAGVGTLFLRYGISMEEVSHVYLAGGFGFKLDCDKAIEIGMLPKCFAGKVEPIGNSSLGGAVKFLTEKETRERVVMIGGNSREINLPADKDFNQLYMDAMYFEKA